MKKEDWVKVDVITCAAPDLRKKSNMHASIINNGTYMNDAELFGYHVKRAVHILSCAAAKVLILLCLVPLAVVLSRITLKPSPKPIRLY